MNEAQLPQPPGSSFATERADPPDFPTFSGTVNYTETISHDAEYVFVEEAEELILPEEGSPEVFLDDPDYPAEDHNTCNEWFVETAKTNWRESSTIETIPSEDFETIIMYGIFDAIYTDLRKQGYSTKTNILFHGAMTCKRTLGNDSQQAWISYLVAVHPTLSDD